MQLFLNIFFIIYIGMHSHYDICDLPTYFTNTFLYFKSTIISKQYMYTYVSDFFNLN